MLRKILLVGLLSAFILPVMAYAGGHGHGHKHAPKKGILLVAFGTSIPEAQIAFENIDKKVKKAFPKVPVRWAYTSCIIREKLAKEGKHLDSPAVALAKMMDEEFTHVAVQSLHTIGGAEFHDLLGTVHAFRNMPSGFEKILVGYPLLATHEDMEAVTKAIIKNIPKKRKDDEAVVLLGHGTHHPANAYYPAIMYYLQQEDPNIFVGTVEGYPEIDEIKGMLKKNGIKKAYLMPFMSVAGDHVINDMAGDEKDSWKSILTKSGIKCEVVVKGTAEYDNMVDIWLDHLKGAMSHFKKLRKK